MTHSTDSVATVVFLITSFHGPNRKTVCNSTSIVACLSVAVGACLPSYCLETTVVWEPFASNGCFSGSIVLALSKYVYATISIFYFNRNYILACLNSLYNLMPCVLHGVCSSQKKQAFTSCERLTIHKVSEITSSLQHRWLYINKIKY
jgi:hypothetical protein